MIYVFNHFELDIGKFELRAGGELVSLEPQVFLLLKLLIGNRDRMVSKDELVEEVWQGRVISDAAIASRVKLARAAIGDDGLSQHSIRTIYGKGFRFVAETTERGGQPAQPIAQPATEPTPPLATLGQKPSIAVLPFRFLGPSGPDATLADALPHDLIQALSQLRWLLVIARGTAFRFRSPVPDVMEIGKTLNVRYVLSGTLELYDKSLTIIAELSDSRNGGVIWSDRITTDTSGVHELRADLVARVVSCLEVYIPLNEARIARLSVSENLDAWSNYHLGLQHMYRFTPEDNAVSTGLFERAVAQDPGFARAHAGLSFTSFQTAFMKFDEARETSVANALRFAERSIELDPLDPFSNFTMGRAQWLSGDLDSSKDWLERAISLSPNYAQGHYSHAFTNVMSGRAKAARDSVETAFILSPMDPFIYAMLGTRAMSYVLEGDYETASFWAEKAARAPGSHFLIAMIAALTYSLSDNREKAAYWSANVRQRRPDADQAHFFASFPFSDQKTRQLMSEALAQNGF